MAEEERTRRWRRFATPTTEIEPIQALRAAIVEVRKAPRDPEARRLLRALAADLGMWEQLALLLADEARAAARDPDTAVAFYEELADVHDNLDQPLEVIAAMEAVVILEPNQAEHHDRLAWLYRRAGAWAKAAHSYERVSELARDDRARAALRAAGKLYRDNGRLDRAVAMYRGIVERRPTDTDAWRALDDLLGQLGKWRELAEVRGALAERVEGGVEKAVLLRAQARALEQAGNAPAAAELVARASRHAPEDVSSLVDYAQVLVREGRAREAAELLAKRVTEAVANAAPTDRVAALRMRLVGVLEDADEREAAAAVLEELLAAAPEYLPALERMAAHAAQDPDPRVHARALLQYAAALPDGEDRSGAVIAAGRRFRDARDYGAAVRVFQDAHELAPEDEELRQELEDARSALIVERAAAEASTGDTKAAERRLRSVLASRPHHLDANLALVELLAAGRRNDEAAEHLRDTLGCAPAEIPGSRLAPLVHRYAQVMAALGEADHAHQLLHEAHHLDRKNLLVTLALGESCFARKLWREASLQLGSLAEHPEAPRHAAAVAKGLVRAAQAEVRALRPQNANKHHEAAVRLDPACAPAWHALAETAIEAGDLVRAADCLEREATATTEPRDRLRLFDAVGDLALDVLGDPARAERCWIEVAGAGSSVVLEKLLALQRRRGAGVERGDTCVRLAELITDERAERELIGEAAEAFAAGGDLVRACATATRLVIEFPLELDALSRASAIAIAAGELERAASWLRNALAAWDRAGDPAVDPGEDDPRRAELWRRLGDAESRLGKQHAALAAYRRAVGAAPESDAAHASRRGLVELASATGKPANTSRVALIEVEQDPEDVIAWARELARGDNVEDARAAYELARAVGVQLEARDDSFLAQHPLRVMASDEAYSASLDEADRRAVIDDEEDGPLAEVFEMLGEVSSLMCPDARTALSRAGLAEAKRVSTSSTSATAALYPQIAKALGGPPTLLYTALRTPEELMLLLSAPPVVVIGQRLRAFRARSQSEQTDLVNDTELRFMLGHVVELSRPRRIFAAGSTMEELSLLVDGLWHAFGRHDDDGVEPAIAIEADRLRATLPLTLRRRIGERLQAVDRASIDPQAYLEACERSGDRAGLLACGHVDLAVEMVGGPQTARHLVRLAATPAYLAARRKLRARR